MNYVYKIRKELYTENIFVWDTSVRSLDIFVSLALNGVKICGWITPHKTYDKKILFNRDIYWSESSLIDKTSCLLIVDDYSVEEMVGLGFCYICYEDCFEKNVNKELRKNPNYIYGAGNGAISLIRDLEQEKISIKGIVATEICDQERLFGYKVKKYSDHEYHSAENIIISVSKSLFLEELWNDLEKRCTMLLSFLWKKDMMSILSMEEVKVAYVDILP